MSLFSSTQPSLRARILPRFPASVVGGNGVNISKSGLTYTFSINLEAVFEDLDDLDEEGRLTFIGANGLLSTSNNMIYDGATNTLSVDELDAEGNIHSDGNVTADEYLRSGVVAVASLPAAGVKGRRYFVTDATATTFASVVVGGGANNVPVYDDGTNWRIG